MKRYHPLFHKFKSFVGYSIAIVIISLALVISGIRFLLTTANLYHQEVENLASSLLEQPVKIGRMDAKLSGLVPTLIFHNVDLTSEKSSKTLVSLSQIDIGLSVDALLWQRKIMPDNITIRGVDLQVTRTVEGKIKIKGIDLDGLSTTTTSDLKNSSFKQWILQRSEIGFENSTLAWKDEQHADVRWFFDNINILLKNDDARHQFVISSTLPKMLGHKIKLAVDLRGDISDSKSWQSKFYIESYGVNLKPVHKYIKNFDFQVKKGIVDLKFWGNWENQELTQLSGDLNLTDFIYQFKRKKPVKLDFVAGQFDAGLNEDKFWNVGINKFTYLSDKKDWPQSNVSLLFNLKNNKIDQFYANATQLNLAALSHLVSENNLVGKETKKLFELLQFNGEVKNLKLAWQENEIRSFETDFFQLSTKAWKKFPEINGVNGNLNFTEQKGKIKLTSNNMTLNFPKLFRNKFLINEINADIEFSNSKLGVLIDINHIFAKNPAINAVSKAKLWLPKSSESTYMDLQTYIHKGDLAKISGLLPVGIMEKNLVGWLDHAFVSGDAQGLVVFNGTFADFPFRKNEGVFKVDVNAKNLELNYNKGWPQIKNAHVNSTFSGLGMDLYVHSGETLKNIVNNSSVKIKSFSNAEVELDFNIKGNLHNIAQYFVNSPILPEAKKTVSSMRLLGGVTSSFKVNIPLGDGIKKAKSISYSGSADLNAAAIYMLKDKLDITDLNGKINFNENGQFSKNIPAKINGEKAIVSLKTLAHNQGLLLAMKGVMNPNVILSRFDIPGARHISGRTNWVGSVLFPPKGAVGIYPVLSVESKLFGVKSELPEKFHKDKDAEEDFKFSATFLEENKTHMVLEFGNKASAILEVDANKSDGIITRSAVSFSNKKAVLPNQNILYIDGSIKKVTPSEWTNVFKVDKNKSNKNRPIFYYPVVLNLESLTVHFPDKENEDFLVKSLSPHKYPVISGIIKKLYFDDVLIGRFDFRTSRIATGIHIDEMILSAKNMKVLGHGDWLYSQGAHETKMDLTLSSDNFGDMLTDLGFSAIIDGSVAKGVGKISWDDALTQFSLYKLNGDIKLNLENGSIKEVDAEAGRIIGLLSLSALPRKLFGDFKDSFKSGFSFDVAKGDITIEEGDAYTDGFEINSSIAEVSIFGRTGLATRDYENTVEVLPDVGGTVAGVAALLVNLPAGIGVWLVDKLTGEQLNEASLRTYEISGSWEKPVIARLEDGEEE